MIQLIRIDDRLLHGQVAYSWKSALGYEAVIIASDNAAADEVRKSALKLATPSGVRLAVRSVEKAAELAMHPKLEDLKVFVIAANPKDVYRFLQLIDEKPTVNLGGIQAAEDKKAFAKAVYLNREDFEFLDKLHEDGIKIEVRQTPSEGVQDYSSLRNKFNI